MLLYCIKDRRTGQILNTVSNTRRTFYASESQACKAVENYDPVKGKKRFGVAHNKEDLVVTLYRLHEVGEV
jgi:uncharacterized protein (UPF0333 family)